MAVKLYNASELSDEALRNVLTIAQRLAGAKGNIVVMVGRGGSYTKGLASAAGWLRYPATGRRKVTTDGGFFEISPCVSGDPLSAAQSFFKVAIHEFAHVRDYQRDPWKATFSHRGDGGRRPRHDSRPEEIRAENTVWEAEQILSRDKARRQRADEVILALGLELERIQH